MLQHCDLNVVMVVMNYCYYTMSTVSNCSLSVIPHIFGHHSTQIAKFMGPTWGLPGPCQPQMGPMLAPWTLLFGIIKHSLTLAKGHIRQSLTAPICDRSCVSCHVQRFVTTSVLHFFLESKSNFYRISYVMEELMVKWSLDMECPLYFLNGCNAASTIPSLPCS